MHSQQIVLMVKITIVFVDKFILIVGRITRSKLNIHEVHQIQVVS